VVPVTNDPQLRRPFGRSRLTNAVMELNDMAVRAYVRMEGNAEFYSSPQIALLGVDPEAFGDGIPESQKFKLAMERLLALTKDSDGDKPVLQQLQQASMTPHSDMLRTIAAAFSAETGIPPSSLGVIHDQPASAEAIRAAEHDLLIDVTYHNKHVLRLLCGRLRRWRRWCAMGCLKRRTEAWRLSASFADPEFRSLSAQADAVQKLASDMDSIGKWDVLLESVFDEGQVERIKEQMQQALVTAPDGTAINTDVEEAETLKAKFDALGVAVRAGATFESAAQMLGLKGVVNSGAVPVTLRLPEKDAGVLEEA
jgi:hypothetical protein